MKKEILYGKSPILEALRAGRRKFYSFQYASEKEDASLAEVFLGLSQHRVRPERTTRSALDSKVPQGLTQGWVAEVSEYPYFDFGDLHRKVKEKPQAIVLALDHLQDPQNLGAILRSAECAGVDGVLIPEDRSCHVTAAACKAAAGAEEHLPISLVTNLVRALEQLKSDGFWVVGTGLPEQEGQIPQDALSFDWPKKTILVMGAEGEGMRKLVKSSCDFLIHLPLAGKISSLNVSAAAAICLYEIVRNKSI